MTENEIQDKLFDVIPEVAGNEATISTDEYGVRYAVIIVEFYDDASETTYKVKAFIEIVDWDLWGLDHFEVISTRKDSIFS